MGARRWEGIDRDKTNGGGWWMVDGSWWMVVGRWWMVDGRQSAAAPGEFSERRLKR